MRPISRHRPGARANGLTATAVALAIGSTGYVAAKTLIAAKLAHMHAAVPDTGAQVAHIHDPAAVFAVLAGCLTLISLLAAATVVGSLAGPSGPSCTAIRWASGLSIWTFILGNVVSSATASASATHPLLLLAVGGAVQASIGGVAGLLLGQWIEARFEQGRTLAHASRHAKPYAVVVDQPAIRMRRRWWAAPAAGRAPPLRFV